MYGLDKSKPWILFVSSFAIASWEEDDLYQLDSIYGNNTYRIYQECRDSYHGCCEWMERLIRNNDVELIYRPHPSESLMDETLKLDETYSNFYIISDFSVKQWACVCDRINLWMSTSNVEMVFMGVDYCVPRPVKISEELEIQTYRGEIYAESYESFEAYNTSNDINTENMEKRKKILSQYYLLDDAYCFMRVADALEDVLNYRDGFQYAWCQEDLKEARIIYKRMIEKSILLEKIYSNKMGKRIISPFLNENRVKLFDERLRQVEARPILEKKMNDYLMCHADLL